MRINTNIGQNNLFIADRLNKSLNQDSSAKKGEQKSQNIAVSLSPYGKADSAVQSLMKQKQSIIDNKNDLIGRTLEKGEDMESIKTQLKNYEKQLKAIDKQIAQTIADYSKQQAEKQKGINYKTVKDEKDAQTGLSDTVLGLSSSMNQIRTVSSVRTRINGEARVLETEIKLDESRGGATEFKKERLADLKQRAADSSTQISENPVYVHEETTDSQDDKTNPKAPESMKTES